MPRLPVLSRKSLEISGHPQGQNGLARIIHELVLRDCEDERATGQPQGLESEAYLNSTSQGSRPEDARKGVHIHRRSSQFINYPG